MCVFWGGRGRWYFCLLFFVVLSLFVLLRFLLLGSCLLYIFVFFISRLDVGFYVRYYFIYGRCLMLYVFVKWMNERTNELWVILRFLLIKFIGLWVFVIYRSYKEFKYYYKYLDVLKYRLNCGSIVECFGIVKIELVF